MAKNNSKVATNFLWPDVEYNLKTIPTFYHWTVFEAKNAQENLRELSSSKQLELFQQVHEFGCVGGRDAAGGGGVNDGLGDVGHRERGRTVISAERRRFDETRILSQAVTRWCRIVL